MGLASFPPLWLGYIGTNNGCLTQFRYHRENWPSQVLSKAGGGGRRARPETPGIINGSLALIKPVVARLDSIYLVIWISYISLYIVVLVSFIYLIPLLLRLRLRLCTVPFIIAPWVSLVNTSRSNWAKYSLIILLLFPLMMITNTSTPELTTYRFISYLPTVINANRISGQLATWFIIAKTDILQRVGS